jgi:mono/diheme cytochrome c family protein
MRSITLVRSFIRYITLLGLFFTLSQTACFKQAEPSTPTRASGPEAVFTRNCVVCHGPGGEGKQLGQLTVPSLREGKARSDADSTLRKQISDGGGGMPAFKYSLTDQEITDLLGYIRSIQGVRQAGH